MRLASSGCCDCWMPVKAEGLSAHFIMELLMRPGPTPRAQGGSRRTSDGGRWEALSGTPSRPGCWRGGSGVRGVLGGEGGSACECGEWCCCWWVLLQGELGDPLLSRGCVKRSLPARRTHRPPLQAVCGESCFCSNRKWQVKRSVSIKICLRCSLVPERKSLFAGLARKHGKTPSPAMSEWPERSAFSGGELCQSFKCERVAAASNGQDAVLMLSHVPLDLTSFLYRRWCRVKMLKTPSRSKCLASVHKWICSSLCGKRNVVFSSLSIFNYIKITFDFFPTSSFKIFRR